MVLGRVLDSEAVHSGGWPGRSWGLSLSRLQRPTEGRLHQNWAQSGRLSGLCGLGFYRGQHLCFTDGGGMGSASLMVLQLPPPAKF